MATQSFFVLNGQDAGCEAEVILKDKNKEELGTGKKWTAPSGRKYIVVKLYKNWIISEEDYKLLKKYKNESKSNN